jgi:hypothetical protein
MSALWDPWHAGPTPDPMYLLDMACSVALDAMGQTQQVASIKVVAMQAA